MNNFFRVINVLGMVICVGVIYANTLPVTMRSVPNESIIKFSDQQKKEKSTFLYFGADWCGPCRQMKQLFKDKDVKELFDLLQQFGAKNEEVNIRDLYATGQIFLEGEMVESLISGLQGRIHRRGANHLICVTEDGIMFKNFLTDVISV